MKGCEELTSRELEVLSLHASGMTAAQIAGHIYLSHHTIQNNLKLAKKRVGAKTLTQVIAWCIASNKLFVRPDGFVVVKED